MSRITISVLLGAGLLAGCSKQDEQRPNPSTTPPPPSSPAPTSPPLQLTITNLLAASTRIGASTNTNNAKTQRAMEVGNAGILHIAFPATWDDKLARVPDQGRFFDSIFLWPRGTNGDFDFELRVDVNNVGEAAASRVNIKEVLQRAGQGELTNSVEKGLEIHEIEGLQTTACYFVVTDKNYNPDHHAKTDYRYLTQGYAKLGELILNFRLVSKQLSPEQGQMLEMIKTAQFEKKP